MYIFPHVNIIYMYILLVHCTYIQINIKIKGEQNRLPALPTCRICDHSKDRIFIFFSDILTGGLNSFKVKAAQCA